MDVKQAKNYRVILIVLLIGITIFSLLEYLVALKEKYSLLKNLSQAKGQVAALEQAVEKEKRLQRALTQDNSTLKDELKKLAQVDEDLQNAQKTIEQLTAQIALSKAENTVLREEKDKLTLELAQVSQERDTLRVRLSSIPELKKAIKEVKMQIRQAKVMMKEMAKKRRTIEGNLGYLIKNGKSTFPIAKIKIEVTPVLPSK